MNEDFCQPSDYLGPYTLSQAMDMMSEQEDIYGPLDEPEYEKKIQVRCSDCGWIDEQDVEFIDIEEDFQGADVLTFKCPQCEQVRKSRRYG